MRERAPDISPVWKSNCRGASPPLLNHGLHAIDATSARQRGNFHTERDRLGVLARLRVSEWRTTPPVDGVDVRSPGDEIFDRSEVAFGRAEVEGRAIVVVAPAHFRSRVEQLPQLDDVAVPGSVAELPSHVHEIVGRRHTLVLDARRPTNRAVPLEVLHDGSMAAGLRISDRRAAPAVIFIDLGAVAD